MKNFKLKKSIISISLVISLLACSKESQESKKELIFLIQASGVSELNLQEDSKLNEKIKSFFSKNTSEKSKNLDNQTIELEALTQLALKEKSVDELKLSALKNREFLDENFKSIFSQTLEKIENPQDFSTSINQLPNPNVNFYQTNQSNTRAWRGRGWMCLAPNFGVLGPHPDFWFSAIVCAWAGGQLYWAEGDYCFAINWSGYCP